VQWLDDATRVPQEDDFLAYVVSQKDPASRGVAVLRPNDLPAGELLIRVSWSTVNHKDATVTQPGNRVARIDPLIPGVDLAGVVLSSTDPRFAPGTEIIAQGHGLGVSHHGGFSQLARIPAAWAAPLPDRFTAREAMALGTAGFTSALSLLLLEAHGLASGEGPVLVTGASGGVGSVAVALLAAAGYEVVASTGKRGEEQRLSSLGATRVVSREDLEERPERTLGPKRWAGAIDCVGGRTLALVLRTLQPGAAVAASGLTGGSDLSTTVYPFVVRGVALLGVDAVETPSERRHAVWERMAAQFPKHLLEHIVAGELTLATLGDGLDTVLANQVTGRFLVNLEAG
jgi:putative YhdH/YhfP family quinone oxidoreductase